MENGFNTNKLKSLKGSDAEDEDIASFPQFNEDVEFV